jgi:hypothetical protein
MNNSLALSQERHSAFERRLSLTAVAALLLGIAVYLLDRDWTRSLFMESFAGHQWPRLAVFGALGECLPSFLHAYAITVLLIVALWPWPWIRSWVCPQWFILASLLEWLQSDAGSAWISETEIPLMACLKSYSVRGRFDYLDLLATGVGCVTALAVTIAIVPHRQRTSR